MGSVGDDYRCPTCGRVGNGGYVLDWGPPFAVCTNGPHSCLWYRLVEEGPGQVATASEILAAALRSTFSPKRLEAWVFTAVSRFLIEDQDPEYAAWEASVGGPEAARRLIEERDMAERARAAAAMAARRRFISGQAPPRPDLIANTLIANV